MNPQQDGKPTSKKNKTTKSRRETAVQGTNDNSIVSKCSMAAQGYFEDNFLQNFVLKITRRAPLIHRGYYIRAKTIDHILKTFLAENEGPKQIISLGAGFDSAYFRLHNSGLLTDCVFYEVDFPEVVKRKHALIKSNPDLLRMIGETCSEISLQSPLIELSSKTYSLLGVDLSQTNTLEAALKMCDLDLDRPTLLLSECVLTYMTRRCASAVVRWAAETFSNSTFVLYEQINPDDAFGLFMQQHFHTVGSPLKSINYFPTIQSQRDRFLKLGWSDVQALDMNQFYFGLLGPEERDRVEGLEPFDETEEWHLKCAHYMVLCGYHGNCKPLLTAPGLDEVDTKVDTSSQSDKVRISTAGQGTTLKRFGHGTCTVGGNLALSVGGFGEQNGKHMRVTEVTFTDLVTMETQFIDMSVDNNVTEVSRMHATLTCLMDGRIILIGGRLSPMRLCTQVVAIEVRYAKKNSSTKEFPVKQEKPRVAGSVLGNTNCANLMNCGKVVNNSDERPPVNNNNSEISKNSLSLNSNTKAGNRPTADGNFTNISQSGVNNATADMNNAAADTNCGQNVGLVELVADFGASSICDIQGSDGDGAGGGVGEVGGSGGGASGSGCVVGVDCSVLRQTGDQPCPRWRHTAVLYTENGEERIIVFGGRTQTVQALGDCYMYTPATSQWRKVLTSGASPVARHSHTASTWGLCMVVAGGLDAGLRPLDSVHLLDLNTATWTQLDCRISPRYSHTAHVIDDLLVLVGGVSLSHSPLGVALVHLPSGHSEEFSLPRAEKGRLLLLHRHTSAVLPSGQVALLGGGGNCFSFGTLLNSTPLQLDITEAIGAFREKLAGLESP